jgi:aspartyl protease family protein
MKRAQKIRFTVTWEKGKSQMGHIYARIRISNLERTKATQVEAVVDTGAMLTVIPQRIAQELELGQFTREVVETGAGEIELYRSSVRISIEGKESVQNVLISDSVDRVLLRVFTLQTLSLSLDPLTCQFKEKRLLLY